jgi:DNA-directed RNA polymerase beta' subunit
MLGFNKFTGEARYKKILNHVEKNVSICPCCNTSIPHYTFFDDKYMMEIKDKKYPVQYEDIYNIFSNVRDCDIKLLGFNPSHVHPARLIITNLLVVPPCVRPFIRSDDGEISNDDLTCKYIDIIKNNNKLRETTSEKCKLALKRAADRTQVLVCGCCAACVSMFRSCSQ